MRLSREVITLELPIGLYLKNDEDLIFSLKRVIA